MTTKLSKSLFSLLLMLTFALSVAAPVFAGEATQEKFNKEYHNDFKQEKTDHTLMASVVSPAFIDNPAPGKSAEKYEIHFMQDMIDHHMMAVMEAELCLDRAIHEELQQLCEEIIVTQNEEMMMMQSWLLDWYAISYMPHMNHGMIRQMEKLAELDGAEFEIEFMQGMIKHHRMAIKDSGKCVERAHHDELVSLCESIMLTQAQEIEMMEVWLSEWYGK
jgi:uncharacterized protein (DUF305 family)